MADYDIFLSHSSKDKPLVIEIYKDLIAQGFTVWFDKETINPGEEWPQAIQEGIDSSTLLLLIWNKAAKDSKWVQKEITRALSRDMVIITMKLDETELDISIADIQCIDAQNGIFGARPGLMSVLGRYIDSEKSVQDTGDIIWKEKKEPFLRNRFLEENNYRNRNSQSFGVNDTTKTLKLFDGQAKPERFVTLVSIPVPNVINVEKEQAVQIWRDYCSKKYNADTPKWQSIDNMYLSTLRKTQHSVIFYHNPRELSNLDTWSFIKFDRDGVIEFGDSIHLAFEGEDSRSGEKRQGFDLLPIIGTAWKFLYFSVCYYQSVSYEGKFQFLLNFKNTHNTKLDGFAERWTSTFDRVSRAYNQGVAHDENLQFIYDIDAKKILETPSHLENMIAHLGRQIQSAFNLDDRLRFLHSDTHEFDWRRFPISFL